MPLVSVPTYAKERYLALCEEIRQAKTYEEYRRRCLYAEAFFDGVRAVISAEAGFLIGCEADQAVPGDEGAIFGRVHRSPEDFK